MSALPGQEALARFLRGEIARRFGNLKKFANASDYPRSTLYEILSDASDRNESLRELEGALDLPHYILDYIAEGRPEEMGSEYERQIWEIYLLPLPDSSRREWLDTLRARYEAERWS